MNCFQVASDSSTSDDSENNSGNAQLILPAVARVILQALMVIVVLSVCIVWRSRVGRKHRLTCSTVIALLKRVFLLYVTLRLNGSTGLQWKQEISARCAALILVIMRDEDDNGEEQVHKVLRMDLHKTL